MEFSINKMKETIKNEGQLRASKEAAEELNNVLVRFAGDLSEEAIAQAEEDGRVTVRAEDIKDALHKD